METLSALFLLALDWCMDQYCGQSLIQIVVVFTLEVFVSVHIIPKFTHVSNF